MATTAEPQPGTVTKAANAPTTAKGWGTEAPDQPLRPMEFERRALRPDDVAIQITFAGICHSDLHTCRDDWESTIYPAIPGHEIVGTVTAVGDEVTRHEVGDTVAVGCMVDSCMECDQCLAGWEVFCRKGCVQTYNSADYHDGTITKGGYTDHIVVRDHFVLKVPDGMDVSRVAPLLCAGITTYSPLRQYDVGPTSKVAVVGLGGLGHMGVKLAAAMGAHVTMITTSSAPSRRASSDLPGEVVNSVVCAPIAWASLSPMWPRPPRPTTPTREPSPTPQWRSGEKVVMPAHRSGAAAASSRFDGIRSTNA